MKLLGKVVLLALLCACGAWIVALLMAWCWAADPVDVDWSRYITKV